MIAIPIVLNIVEDTKKSATIRSAEMYLHGIEIDVINQQLNKKEIEDGQYNIIEFNNIGVNGEKPSDGMIEILEGKVRSGGNISGNSGYTGMLNDGTIYNGKEWPDEKYYETYTSSINKACSGGVCYGQALSETKNWYGDYAYFVVSSYPWFYRGGGYRSTSNAGLFYFDASVGDVGSNYSFRVVVSLTN